MNFFCPDELLKDEPSFRKKQIREAIFKNLLEDWNEATNLPPALRKKLKKQCPLEIKAELSFGAEAAKALITLEDGLKIETVLMRHGINAVEKDDVGADRNTVCVSSQAGCPLGCSFCATGKSGFKRNLKSFEIVEQVLFFGRLLKKENARVGSVVFMGMGEPMLNYDNVLAAIRILNDKGGLNIGARRISISTVGIVEGIKKLAREQLQANASKGRKRSGMGVNLAISLHAPNDELRLKMMPVNKRYPIESVMEAVREYISLTGRKVMFEYIMIKGMNDSDDCARRLIRLLAGHLCFVNLINYNPTGVFKPSGPARIKKFRQILERGGLIVSERRRFGRSIKGACGQLAGK